MVPQVRRGVQRRSTAVMCERFPQQSGQFGSSGEKSGSKRELVLSTFLECAKQIGNTAYRLVDPVGRKKPKQNTAENQQGQNVDVTAENLEGEYKLTAVASGEVKPIQRILDYFSEIADKFDGRFTYGYDRNYPDISKEEALVMPEDELIESTKTILGREFAPRPKSYVNWRVIEGPVGLHVVDQRRPKPTKRSRS